MKRKKLLLAALTLFITLPLFARSEFWIGGMLRSDRHYLTREAKALYANTPYSINAESGTSYITSVGASFEGAYFPSDIVRVGLITSIQLDFTIGYNNGSGDQGYISYNLDNSTVFSLGLAYNQLFGTFGFFLDGGIYADLARVCQTNIKNYRENGPWNKWTETGYYADAGLLIRHKGGYFKLGIFIHHPFDNTFPDGLRAGLYMGGGAIF